MRILINATTSIGDSIYFSFMLDNIYRHYPEASLQVLCWSPMIDFYKSYGFIEQVVAFDRVGKDKAFAYFLLCPRIDVYIDIQHTPSSGKIGVVAKAAERIGINPHPKAYDCYTHIISLTKGVHITKSFLHGFHAYWPDKDIDSDIRIRLTESHKNEAISLLTQHGITPVDDYIVIHPGSKAKEKLWMNRRWCELIAYLHDHGFKVALVGSRFKAWGGVEIFDSKYCALIHDHMGDRCVNLAGKTDNIMVLAALIQNAQCYFGLDTGPVHLAALLGVPVIELYKYINENIFSVWRPLGEKVTVIKNENVADIPTFEVIEAFERQQAIVSRRTP